MSRATAESLILVNWKGVFYARYEINPHVTALEGANGAGKTTVMIGAYLVLLPDLTRLKFTNLGESGATGGDRGIYGRLGAEGGPAYAYIEFRTGRGARVLAGVQLVRKGEPTVDLHTFIVTDLADDVRLQDLVLQRVGTREQVPELDDLRDAVARVGARLVRFTTAKEYFAALFEQNITPLRLAADEERRNFNDMLRTSMTGGISKTLTNELRTFLLKQESTLGETLTSMRESLSACRATRTRVHTTQVLQAEIRGVYEAGEQMFAAALHATRERSEEARRAAESARAEHGQALQALRESEDALATQRARAKTIDARLGDAQAEAERTAELRRNVTRARGIVVRLVALTTTAGSARGEADARNAVSAKVETRFHEAGKARERADGAWKLATGGLADAERGIDELFRRAAEHRRAVSELARARSIIGADLAPEELDGAHEVIRSERQRRNSEAAAIDANIRTAEQRRTTYAAILEALERIVEGRVPEDQRPERARAELVRVAELRRLASSQAALKRQAEEAKARAEKQATARDRARALGVGQSAAAVTAAVEAAGARVEQLSETLQAERRSADRAKSEQEAAKEQVGRVELRVAKWHEVLEHVAQVGEPIANASDLERIGRALMLERDAINAASTTAKDARDAASDAAHQLETAGGAFASDLVRIAERVGGELLAVRYDEVPPKEAGLLQARLGPLAEAIVVDDPATVARRLADVDRAVGTIWLVRANHPVATAAGGEIIGRDVVVEEPDVVRITRTPTQPTLGRRARAERVAELRAEAARHEAERLDHVGRLARLEGRTTAVDALRGLLEILVAGDPASALADARARLTKATVAITGHENAAEAARKELGQEKPRAAALQKLLVEAHLLDPPDHAELAAELAAQHAAAGKAGSELARISDDATVVGRGLVDLAQPPPTVAEVAALRTELAGIEARRAALFEADEALTFVREHRDALAWTDAAQRLEQGRAVVPELKAAAASAATHAAAMRTTEDAARVQWTAAVEAAQKASGVAVQAEATRDAARTDLAAIGVGEPTEEDVTLATTRASAANDEHIDVRAERDAVVGALATVEAAHKSATGAESARSREFTTLDQEAGPHEERWRVLQASAAEKSALSAAQARRFVEQFTGSGSPKLNTLARTAGAQLVERLRNAQRAEELFAGVRAWVESEDDRSGGGYLVVWLQVLDWLRRRLPAHIADVDDPVASLRLLSEELASLEASLEGQEARLRGQSSDVASTIDVQIRKANGQVHRLNKLLAGVAFGSIGAIRIDMSHVETMGRILRALREGHGQALLFDPGLPIEEALDQLFSRYSGAGGSGQKVLDYREYIQLSAEIKRKSSASWESASATRLSTGEAIGVGAAIMMVVLAEWERDANALRPKKSDGSLRFLFLDEANRLDRGNLDEVFELCRTLELQLLIAAPEVARAAGTTTYRLARIVDGQDEQVVVSGRRTRSDTA